MKTPLKRSRCGGMIFTFQMGGNCPAGQMDAKKEFATRNESIKFLREEGPYLKKMNIKTVGAPEFPTRMGGVLNYF